MFYITKLINQEPLFIFGNSTNEWSIISQNWERWSYHVWFKWKDGYLIQNGKCVPSWTDGFYQHSDIHNLKLFLLCLPCHENCKSCNGANFNNCLSCYEDKQFNQIAHTWNWGLNDIHKYLGSNGTWVSKWEGSFSSIYKNSWMKNCPKSSTDFMSTINISKPREKQEDFNCFNLTRHLFFKENITYGYPLERVKRMDSQLFTFTFWIYFNSSSSIEIELFSFGKILFIYLFKNNLYYFNFDLKYDIIIQLYFYKLLIKNRRIIIV